MGFNSKYTAVLAIGLGVYAIAKRNIGLGPSVLIRPQFSVTGLPAVFLGIALVGIGVVMILSGD